MFSVVRFPLSVVCCETHAEARRARGEVQVRVTSDEVFPHLFLVAAERGRTGVSVVYFEEGEDAAGTGGGEEGYS